MKHLTLSSNYRTKQPFTYLNAELETGTRISAITEDRVTFSSIYRNRTLRHGIRMDAFMRRAKLIIA